MSWQRMAAFLAIIYGLVAAAPIFAGDTRFILHILTMCLIWAVVAACWDLIMGFAGIFSFGQVAFFVIGAYGSAILSIHHGWPPVLSMMAAGGIAAAVGVLVGLPCLRLKGAYIALVTFAVHMILEPLLKSDLGRALGTGGTRGILSIPPIDLFGATFSAETPVPTFYLTWLLSAACAGAILFVIKSPWGIAFLALKDAEDFARSLGVNPFKYKLRVFALTSFLTGMMGGFYSHYVGMLSTRLLGIDLFVTLMVMLVVGGIGQYPGAVLGAFVTVTLNELLSPLGPYRPLILGALVVILTLLLPDGVIGLFRKGFETEPRPVKKPL